jgi:4-hydroxy-3-polyprenylbenzoate decarboxylase
LEYGVSGWELAREHIAKNGSMEVAIAIGVEPIATLCAGTPLETGISEADIAGGLRGEPEQLVRCETVDLMVPATSEIVIEGEFKPDETMMEGPFGEYTGYSSTPPSPRPIIRVKAVTHRNNPIFTMACPGVPLEDNVIWYFAKSAAFLEALLKRGLPVTAVNAAPESASLLTVVSVNEPYPGIAADIAHLLWGIDSAHASPYIVIVQDDVDPFNMSQVIHTIVTRCHPSRGIVTADSVPVTPLLPFLSPYERQYKLGAMVYFDCTWPHDWKKEDIPKRISFRDAYPDDIQRKALEKWMKQGVS